MEPINPKLYNWASNLADNTLQQAERSSTMPFIYPHLALMPDAHLGKGATVGSVIPTLGAVMPAAVGVDIGCGMIAVRTQFTIAHIDHLIDAHGGQTGEDNYAMVRLREAIEAAIPLSPGKYNQKLTDSAHNRVDALDVQAINGNFFRHLEVLSLNWRLQLGSLGGGNHFIEVVVDEASRIWLFLHSGSRGIGNKIAQEHIKIARGLCEKWWIQLPDPDLAYLVEGTDEFNQYIREMEWAQRFAFLNREEMMDRVVHCFEEWIGEGVSREETINCHHNFTQMEHHFGKDVWLTRKGAIAAGEGMPGLIPGSMGTTSYVVEGLGNKMSLNSSPHGAGRNFSRRKAKETFTHEQLREAMKGIEWRDSKAFLDEIPGAYKDIDQVMDDSRDLVKIKHAFRQLVNVKGT